MTNSLTGKILIDSVNGFRNVATQHSEKRVCERQGRLGDRVLLEMIWN